MIVVALCVCLTASPSHSAWGLCFGHCVENSSCYVVVAVGACSFVLFFYLSVFYWCACVLCMPPHTHMCKCICMYVQM